MNEETASEIVGNVVPDGIESTNAGIPLGAVDKDPWSWIGQRVFKVGRSTGCTVGVVSAVSIDGLTVLYGRQNIVFDDVFEIRYDSTIKPFSQAGGSGSLVILEQTNCPIGIIFANAESENGFVSYACRLDRA